MGRSRVRRYGVLFPAALVALVVGGPAFAQEWSAPNPEQGPPGTNVTISGTLIGCYASGPGLESATWGFPNRVVYYWNPDVYTEAQAAEFQQRLTANPNDRSGLQEIASHVFGSSGWTLSFSVPSGSLGVHLNVLSFEPQCNYKSQEKPDGFTQDPSNFLLSFCVLDAQGVCPSAPSAPSTVRGGRPAPGGYWRGPGGTGSVDVLGKQIAKHNLVGGAATVGIIVIAGWAFLAWWSGTTMLGLIGLGPAKAAGTKLLTEGGKAGARRLTAQEMERRTRAKIWEKFGKKGWDALTEAEKKLLGNKPPTPPP